MKKELKHINEVGGDYMSTSSNHVPILGVGLGLGILGLIAAAAKKVGAIFALRKLKHFMVVMCAWVKYGYHNPKDKGNMFQRRYWTNEADKQRPCYSNTMGNAERRVITETEKMLQACGMLK